ncbi:MAG TPA: hypothetical protein PLK12_06345 [Prolixibacteraceae bacterium]|nr:hypothetical protein [Prolixibacteraceae bacterium]
MKTIILLLNAILFLFASLSANAQQYESCFGEESTQWVIVKPSSWWGVENAYSPKYYLIDSIKCYGEYIKEQPFGVVYFETDGNSKLWRWDTESNEKSIIMDLNWEVGDSIFIKDEDFIMHYESRPYAIVDSVFYNETNRKTIHTDLVLRTDTTLFNLTFIEGIGPNASMYYQEYYGFFWGNSHLLLCAHKDDVLCYVNIQVSDDCTYIKPDAINTIGKASEVMIRFQSNTIELTFDDSFSGRLCFISTNGKAMKRINVNSKKRKFDINDLPAGPYIVQVTHRNGELCVNQKFTKN